MPWKNKEYERKYRAEWAINKLKARRNEWIKEHGPCAACGTWERLEVDHINPEEKEVSTWKVWSLSYANPRRIKELDKCQVLCYSCHKAKSSFERKAAIQHGTIGGYSNLRCRCCLCTEAKRVYRRKYYLEHRRRLIEYAINHRTAIKQACKEEK